MRNYIFVTKIQKEVILLRIKQPKMAINPDIQNIIFDLGGVLLNIDYSATLKAFKELGLDKFDEVYSQSAQKELFDDFETGKISAQEFRNRIKQLSSLPISDKQIDSAWNAMLLDLPKERLEILDKLWDEHRLFLLSNTNDIHISAYANYLQKEFGFPNLSHLFEKEYYSYKIGMRKPSAEIFKYVLEENNLLAKETMFIDDSPQHVESAAKCGIQALLLDVKGGQTILDIFS